MFSSTLKRSAATLGVVTGLLAAAAPASAQILDGPVLAKPGSSQGVKPPAAISGGEMSNAVKAPASLKSAVFTSVSNVALLGGIIPGGAIISSALS